MKYSVLFASTAAAYAVTPSPPVYGAASTPVYAASSAPVYSASVPVYGASSVPVYAASSTKKDTCYGTITPGYGQAPVTITKQGQSYPTCASTAYGTCAKWGKSVYVSTTIKDYNNKPVCVTNVNKKIVLYSTQSTVTYPAGSKPTGAGYKQDSTGCYYQVYKKIEYAPYGKLGSNALTGFSGSGLCKSCCDAQPVWVKEYQNGKWNNYTTTQTYGVPTAKVTTYATPGVYTVPSKALTVTKTVYYAAEVTKTATAGETCTYGGKYAVATGTGYITVPYGAYTTKVYNGKTSTIKIVKTTTVYASSTGKVTVCPPTTSVYAKATTYCYPTASWYAPGIYSYGAKTVTITSANQAYTCPYEQRIYPSTAGYPVKATSTPGYPVQPYSTPAYPVYPTGAYSTPAYPVYPTGGYPSSSKPSVVPPYPMNSNSTSTYVAVYPSGTPVYSQYGQPGYSQYGQPGYPIKASSTPCTLEKKVSPTPYTPSNNNVYNAYPAQPASSYPAQPVYAASYPPSYPPSYSTPSPVQPYNNYPAQSTPCTDEQKYPTYPTKAAGYN